MLSVALGLTVLGLFLNEIGRAPWSSAAARHLRAMKDRTAPPLRYDTLRIADLGRLPRRASLAEYAALERRGVTIEGYVQRMLRATDGDFHLDYAPELDADGHLVPYVSVEITPQWLRASPHWEYDRLVAAFRPYFGGASRWDDPPRRLRLSGWLMYDYPYEGGPVVFGFPPHIAQWEIHPVTRIEVWDELAARFVEIPR